jgi:hypothetical protein
MSELGKSAIRYSNCMMSVLDAVDGSSPARECHRSGRLLGHPMIRRNQSMQTTNISGLKIDIDDQVDIRRLLHRKISGFITLKKVSCVGHRHPPAFSGSTGGTSPTHRSKPLGAVWSGYEREPAAQVRRSASLLMTHNSPSQQLAHLCPSPIVSFPASGPMGRLPQ